MENPFPESSPLYEPAALLLARDTAPLLPKAPFSGPIRAQLHGQAEIDAATPNIIALLHLMNDDLETAHQIVQPHEDDRTAAYIHAIVHRREGDFSNAKYWLRRAAGHPQLPADANAFVDECQRVAAAADGNDAHSATARRTLTEMAALLSGCLADEQG